MFLIVDPYDVVFAGGHNGALGDASVDGYGGALGVTFDDTPEGVCIFVKVMCMMDLLVADIVTELFLLLSDHFVIVGWWDSFDCDFLYVSQHH